MTGAVRIEASRQRIFSEVQPAPEQARWLKDYYRGLLAPFDIEVDDGPMAAGKNNNFLDMGAKVLTELRQECVLDDVGLFIMAHQTFDTYFPFQSTTTLLCRQFDISSPAVALTEQEADAPYIGLEILLAALGSQKNCDSALLLVLDQTTLPYRTQTIGSDCLDSAIALKLSVVAGSGPTVRGQRYWQAGAGQQPMWVVERIYAFLDASRTHLDDVHVVTNSSIVNVLKDAVPAVQSTVLDARFMSCSGLMTAMQLLDSSTGKVLLAHQGMDDHLFLFLFEASVGGRG